MLKFFRMLSLVEGISLIILLFVAMPAKYYYSFFDSVWVVGMIHGILWLFYVIFSLVVSHRKEWSVGFWLLVLLSSIIPFGCFILDFKLREELTLKKQNS